eukprot:NP_508252.1 Uncharacterized protein CELE_F56C3.5 [Caenorhabditis elegans]
MSTKSCSEQTRAKKSHKRQRTEAQKKRRALADQARVLRNQKAKLDDLLVLIQIIPSPDQEIRRAWSQKLGITMAFNKIGVDDAPKQDPKIVKCSSPSPTSFKISPSDMYTNAEKMASFSPFKEEQKLIPEHNVCQNVKKILTTWEMEEEYRSRNSIHKLFVSRAKKHERHCSENMGPEIKRMSIKYNNGIFYLFINLIDFYKFIHFLIHIH